MKKKLRLIGPLLFVVIIYRYIDIKQLTELIDDLNWFYVVFSLSMAPPLLFVRSFRWKRILVMLDIDYPLWNCFKIYCVEMVAVMIVSAIGTFIKALYLQETFSCKKKPYLSVITDKYYDYILPLIFGLSSIVSVMLNINQELSLIVLLIITFLLFVPTRKMVFLLSDRFFPKQLKKLLNDKHWSINIILIQMYDLLDFKTYILSVCSFISYFTMIFFLNMSIGLNLNFAQVVLIMTITSLVTMVPISFLGIGTRDIGLIVIFDWFGYLPEQAIALSLALLLLRLVFILIGAFFWYFNPPPLQLLYPFSKQ